jgi:6-phosphofructokinase 1
VNIGEILKQQVTRRLKEFGLKATIVEKNIGYELRCADPIPFDMEYSRDLGYAAAKFILSGGSAAMVSMQGGHFVPVDFASLIDPHTGRTRVRRVNIRSERYAIGRSYMIRLKREDFQDAHETAKLAAICGVSLEEFKGEFEYLMAQEPPRLKLDADQHGFIEDEAMGETHVQM